ncbi:MAG: hypothetical protein NTV23_11990 [Propionibacteriales bacterium]|nr:hypothetical protein [Propionibacteriales bacterium]
MGRHSGDHDEPELHIPHGRTMLVLAGSVTATLIAWGFLVVQAIKFGGNARDGQGAAWVFLFLATLGATACMFMALILGTKLRALLKGEEPVKPPRVQGGRRRL